MADDPNLFVIDENYELDAPQFYDFINGESEEEKCKAELWFETSTSYAPSPFMPRIKTGRSVQLVNPCDFTQGDELQKNTSSAAETTSSQVKQQVKQNDNPPSAEVSSSEIKEGILQESVEKQSTSQDICTPGPPTIGQKIDPRKTDADKQKTAKKLASMLRNPSVLKSKTTSQSLQGKNISFSVLKSNTTPQPMQVKSTNPASMRKQEIIKSAVGMPNFGQENQARKRQKLESGKVKQILNIKPQNLPHKTRSGATTTLSSSIKIPKEDRKMYAREPVPPAFISTAEMMKKFQSSTREMPLPCISSSTSHRKPKLTLTAPKELEFETTQRVRPTTVKSSAELEEEMLAKVPKFKARPLNKKIFELPTLPALSKSTPQLPEFKEFHLETMARANQNAETCSIFSMESTQSHQRKPHLTTPKPPVLQTLLRARPAKIKSSEELEKEELEKIPKFKARPLNKKIFESKVDPGMFCNTKKQVTVPQEFHFATDERVPPPATISDLFDKLCLNSGLRSENTTPRNTTPNPFHLYTEERGAEKEQKLFTELLQKQIEEERSRVHKATPYPYTTDYPVIPPKPEPKHCTEPEPFQLESLARHEREMQRELEERQRLEKEEEKMRTFKARPILIEDPTPVPEKARKPLTQVQEFNLHVEHRAADRAEFDKKIKEKELMYQRYREEAEAARMMEEEKCLKQLRRTLVPHARPVPKFDHPFLPQKSSKPVTKARSPKLILKRQERRKMVCPYAAVSSPACQMR